MATPTPSSRNPRHLISPARRRPSLEFSSAKTSQTTSNHKKHSNKRRKHDVSNDSSGQFRHTMPPVLSFSGQSAREPSSRSPAPGEQTPKWRAITRPKPLSTTLPTIEMPTTDFPTIDFSASNHRTPGVRSIKPPQNLAEGSRVRSQAPSPPPIRSFTAKYPVETATIPSEGSDSEPLAHKVARKPISSPDVETKPENEYGKDQVLDSKKHLAYLRTLHHDPVVAQAIMEDRRLALRSRELGFAVTPRRRQILSDLDSSPESGHARDHPATQNVAAIEAEWTKIKNSRKAFAEPVHPTQPPCQDTPAHDDTALSATNLIRLDPDLQHKRQPRLKQSDITAALALRADLPPRLLNATHRQAVLDATASAPESADRISELTVVLTAARAMLNDLVRHKPADDLVRAAQRFVGTHPPTDAYRYTTAPQQQNYQASKVEEMGPERVELLRIAEERQVEIERLKLKNARLRRQKDMMRADWHAERAANRALSDSVGTSEVSGYSTE